ncbi:MAG: hypothetical protein MZU97_13525 [Bacillus subtilis]|nr:hypothetical protein [Bacillus subtilis]
MKAPEAKPAPAPTPAPVSAPRRPGSRSRRCGRVFRPRMRRPSMNCSKWPRTAASPSPPRCARPKSSKP